jgi:hypothetical protein
MQLIALKVSKFDVIRDGKRVPLPAVLETRLAPLDEFLAAVAAAIARPAEPDPLTPWGCALQRVLLSPDRSRCAATVTCSLGLPSTDARCRSRAPIVIDADRDHGDAR